MGLKGAMIGGGLGALFGRSVWGALLGGWIGHGIERWMASERRKESLEAAGESRQKTVFLATVAAMLAKMAKADGRVSRDEIVSVETAFRRLGFSEAARAYAVGVFRRAKDDRRTIFEYACEFSAVVSSLEVRELLYELLWDIACADGRVSPAELDILRRITGPLRIRAGWFTFFSSSRLRNGPGERSEPEQDSLAEAYELLGAAPSESDEEVKRRYRDLAKKSHPDALRAQGLPEEMIGKATERMSRINAAWARIRTARGL